jgi:AcrR family transcriptional regulator
VAASKAADPSAPRERRNREQEVLEAAIDLFFRKGYASASIQDVADQVGVLKGSLYYYIDSKEDLLFRIFQESHRQASEIVAEARALEASPLDRLRFYLERYVRWYLENVERVSLYFSELRHLTGERAATVRDQRDLYDGFVRDCIEGAKRDGVLAADVDVRYMTFFLLGAVNEVPTWYRRHGKDAPEQIAAEYADIALGALRGYERSRAPAPRRGRRRAA